MNDLIERLTELKEWHIKTANSRKNLRKKAAHTMRADALSKAVAALSPVLPDDVVKEARHLRFEHERRAANMLEQLARKLEVGE